MIKVIGDYTRKVINENGDLEITLTIKDYASKKRIDELNKDTYQFEIRKPRSKRSLNQNRFFWEIVGQISKKLYQDEMDTYIALLEDSSAKFEYVLGLESIEDELKKSFRAVKVVRPQEYQGKKMIVYKCFIGSSKMNVDEMNVLINKALEYASELDIPIDEYNF